jgi:excisionase family DNA binding protein
MKLTMGQAAKQANVSKPTLSRWIKKGHISAEKQANGSYMIDASELDRILELKSKGNAGNGNGNAEMLQLETPNETHALQRENELLREALADVRIERDAWWQQAQQLLLTSNAERKSFWARIFGG